MDFNLSSLGISKNESKAYETLVKLGKAPAALISKESGVPYGKIYNVLAALEHDGLVKVIPGDKKQFAPTDPDNILSLIKKKQDELSELNSKAKELKRFYDLNEEEPILMATGKKNFHLLAKQMKDAAHQVHNIKFNVDPKPEWMRSRKRALSKGVVHKELVRYDKETKSNVDKWKKLNPDMRVLENEGVAMGIVDEDEMILALLKSNTTLLIRDKPFIKLMIKLFSAYFEKAKKIK